MKEINFCQSCGMPLKENDCLYGTNADNSNNKDYCIYCFKDGNFTSDITMDEMINFCAPLMAKENAEMSEEGAKQIMKEFFPKLKRWQDN